MVTGRKNQLGERSKGNMGAKCRVRNEIGKYIRDEMERIYKHMQTHTIKELMFIFHYCVNINVSRKEGGGVVESSRLRRCVQRRCAGSS